MNSLAYPQKVRKLRQKTSFDCALDTPQQTCGGVALRTGQFGSFENFLDTFAFGIFFGELPSITYNLIHALPPPLSLPL